VPKMVWDPRHKYGRMRGFKKTEQSQIVKVPRLNQEPRWRSRYSDWLRAGRRRGQSSSPGRVKSFLFSTSSRPAMGPTQPPIQGVPVNLSPGVKRPGRKANHSPPTSAEVKKI
jgi:hypothetical protein